MESLKHTSFRFWNPKALYYTGKNMRLKQEDKNTKFITVTQKQKQKKVTLFAVQ